MALLFVRINVQVEKRKEVRQTIDSLAAQVKREKGCVEAGFYQNSADDTDILFLTTWTDRNALDAYLKSVHFTVLLGIRGLLSTEPTIRICEYEYFRRSHC